MIASGRGYTVGDVGVDEVGDAVDERVREARGQRLIAPRELGFLLLRGGTIERRGERQHAFGSGYLGAGRRSWPLHFGSTVQHEVLDGLAQRGIELLVHRELAGVHDRHVEAGLDRVIEEHRVHRLAHARRGAKRERQVRHAARHLHARQLGLDAPHRVDEVDRVRVVLLDAGADREDVRIEDDVLGREADLLDEDLVRALRDRDAMVDRRRLAGLVERHHDDRGAERAHDLRLAHELGLAFLERDRVDDALALQALEPGLDHRELRRIDHHRDARDVGLGRDQIHELAHRDDAIEHALVHAHVEDVRAALDLLARDRDCLLELVVLDQPAELRGPGHVRALADHDEVRLRRDRERLEASEPRDLRRRRHAPRRDLAHRRRDGRDVLGSGAAATADEVEHALARECAEHLRHVLRRVVVLAELVR
jgi:hypothetical protein